VVVVVAVQDSAVEAVVDLEVVSVAVVAETEEEDLLVLLLCMKLFVMNVRRAVKCLSNQQVTSLFTVGTVLMPRVVITEAKEVVIAVVVSKEAVIVIQLLVDLV
jgi:hypothetical protein